MDFKIAFISIMIVGVIAGVVSFLTDLGFWLIFIVVAAGFLFNGFVISIEDEMPGCFNNPDGTNPPLPKSKFDWIGRALILVLGGITAFLLLLWKFG